MAKLLPSLINASGTIEGTTFVQNKLYGPYIRAPRGTYKKAALNDSLQTNANNAAPFNLAAKTIYDQLKEEAHDNQLWPRILGLFFSYAKDGKIVPECLLGLECNLPSTAEEVLGNEYRVVATPYRKKLHITLTLQKYPDLNKKTADSYAIRFVVLYPDFITHTSTQECIVSSVQPLSADHSPIEVVLPMPTTKSLYLVLMSVQALNGKKDVTTAKENFLRVVAIG